MLPKRYRLVRSEDFARIREEGRCFATGRLVLCYRATYGSGLRVGFSVSKRVGGAVVRNRVKRRLRACMRPLCAVIAPGTDLVVIARRQAAEASSFQLGADLEHLLGRAQLYAVDANGG